MFERYTESARRVVFYARYEASFAAACEISTVDLLRGIVRESKPADQGIEWIRANMDPLCETLWPAGAERKRVHSRTEEIRVSDDAKRSLACAADTSGGNPRRMIDAPTSLLGILAFQNEASQLRWFALTKGILRRNRMRLLRILISLLVMLGVVALLTWFNR